MVDAQPTLGDPPPLGLPALVSLALAVRGISLYPLIKFALLAPAAVFLCFFIGHYLRKLPLARSIL